MEENISGEWFISDTCFSVMVHAKLGIAEVNSGKLVSLVRKQAYDKKD
jgi:MinD superfamily P-loop ATPase